MHGAISLLLNWQTLIIFSGACLVYQEDLYCVSFSGQFFTFEANLATSEVFILRFCAVQYIKVGKDVFVSLLTFNGNGRFEVNESGSE